MTIIKTKHTKDFTVLPNSLLRDSRLSFKARGLLAMILTHHEEWSVNKGWIESQTTEGREAITSALKELKALGYVTFQVERLKRGGFDNVWCFYDTDGHSPEDADGADGCRVNGVRGDGKPSSSEELRGKKNQGKEEPTEEKQGSSSKEPRPKNLNAVQEYAVELKAKPIEAEKFFDHFESNGWKVGKNPMKDWHAAFRGWVRRAEEWERNGTPSRLGNGRKSQPTTRKDGSW